MPKASVIQTDFGAGEVSPLTYGRVQSQRYKQSLATCQNYIPTLQGALVRRPGTKFCNLVKNQAHPPVLIPFNFSVTQAYMLEFGYDTGSGFNNGYIRFYANNGQIVCSQTTYQVYGTNNGGTTNFAATRATINPNVGEVVSTTNTLSTGAILEVPTPYLQADLAGLRFAQSADTLYVSHPNYPLHKLQRFGQNYWTFRDVYFQDGPYLPLNSYLSTGDSTTITLTPSAVPTVASPTYNVQTGPNYVISGAANNGSGLIRLTTSAAHTYVSGQNIYVSGIGGTTEANNIPNGVGGPAFWQITVIDSTHFDLNGSAFVHTFTSNGACAPALFNTTNTGAYPNGLYDNNRKIALQISGQRYWGTLIGAFTPAFASVYSDPSSLLPSATTATAWQLGVYSAGTGYPSCVTFHQSRIALAGAANYPQRIDGSYIGNTENFAPSIPTTLAVTDSNAYSFTLASQDVNAIKWMKSSTQGLLAGTQAGEFSVASSSTNAVLSPTNVNASQTSTYGSLTADAVQMGTATLYIQRAARKLRELNFFYQLGTFRSTDLTALSEHITTPTISKLAVTNETQPTVWAIRSDGALLTLVYDRDASNLSAGWARQILGGRSDAAGTPPVVVSIASIPSPDTTFDQLWMVVKRYINGATVYSVEYNTKIFDNSFLQEDAYHVDCGATFDNPKTITNVTTTSGVQVTAAAHGLSVADTVIISQIQGMNISVTDINGGVTTTNLLNGLVFTVGTVVDTNNVILTNSDGSAITVTGFSAYISGGQLRKRVTTISGLTWLEGETVSTWADGAFGGTGVVNSSGVLTLANPAGKVQIGYTYTSQGQTLRPEAGAADGTSIGKTRRPNRAAVMMNKVAEISVGTNFQRMLPVGIVAADNVQSGVAFPLYSGIRRVFLEAEYNYEGQFCFQQTQPGPGTILSITLFMEEEDV